MKSPNGGAARRAAVPPRAEVAATNGEAAPTSAGPGASVTAPAAEPRLLAGQVGAEVAAALSSALERVEQLARTGRIGRHSLQALQDEIHRARDVAMLGQQVSRLAAGHVRQAPETLELPQLLREALSQRLDAVASRGIELRQVLQPATVSADPSLLFALLLSLLDWAIEHCRSQTVSLHTGLNPWPVHAVLECRFTWCPPDRLAPEAELAYEVERLERGDDPSHLDTVAWRLVEQAARAMGVSLTREDTASQVRLRLAFPEAPRRWPRLVESLADVDDGAARLHAQPLAGLRLLVFAQRTDVRHVVHEATVPTGLMVDFVATLAELRECALQAPPDVLLVDHRNSEVDRVLAEVHAGGRGPVLVHVAEAFRGVELSSSGRFEIVRVSRDTAVRDLPAALGYALNR